MLILTRRIGESLLIGDEVSIKVLDVKGGQIRLGVDAPRDIAINREELARPEENGTPATKAANVATGEKETDDPGQK